MSNITSYGPQGFGGGGDVWRFIAALQVEMDALRFGGATPLDGSVTDAKVAAGAAIAQAKIAGLVAQLAGLVGADNAEAIARAAADAILTTNVAGKAADNAVVHLAGAETVTGAKTFSAAPVLPAGSVPKASLGALAIVDADVSAISEAKIANLVNDLAGKQATIPAGTYVSGGGRLTVAAAAPAAPAIGDIWVDTSI